MSALNFVVILGLSVIVTYIGALVDFVSNINTGKIGIPFGFASASLMGSSTENSIMMLDIISWFLIILAIWQLIQKYGMKKKK